jgi:hypothetical protein
MQTQPAQTEIKRLDNKYSNPNKRNKNLGIGLLDWPNHVRAFRAKWILNYLNAVIGPLKQVLDQWLARTRLGRRAALFT